MLFNSFSFLVFFPLVTLVYYGLPQKFRWFHLLVASCLFYAAFIPAYLLILLLTIVIDYAAGIWIEGAEGRRRKYFLIISIIANIGLLAIFKYYDFFIDNINHLLLLFNVATHPIPYLNIILPIGLSFHTFQAMSYTIEVYHGHQKAERHLGIYALYVMFYPQLVAGPIERPQNLLHQFHDSRKFNGQLAFEGFTQMVWGFFKKIVVADNCAIFVNQVWSDYSSLPGSVLIIGAILFSFQIYCDFSGYSDIAIGSAKVMGFTLMTNFKYPYFSTNIREFWKRWHISLSTWFRDYVYFSLGGSKHGKLRAVYNVFIVFLLSGFWHGANWTFVVWGLFHAILFIPLFILEVPAKAGEVVVNTWKTLGNILLTFILVTLCWVFFRSASIQESLLFLDGFMRSGSAADFFLKSNAYILTSLVILFVLIQLVITEWLNRANDVIVFSKMWPIVLLVVEIAWLGSYKNPLSFIYFQF